MKIDQFPGVLTLQFVDRPFTTKTGRTGCQRVKAWVFYYLKMVVITAAVIYIAYLFLMLL